MKIKQLPGIYCYENKINGRRYVGQSINIKNRYRQHENNFKKDIHKATDPKENIALWKASKKYGRENLCFRVLIYCEVEELDMFEEFFIKNLNAHRSLGGYNFAWGGKVYTRGMKHGKDARKNMSNAHKGVPLSKEHAKSLSKSLRGVRRVDSVSQYCGIERVIRKNKVYWINRFTYKKEKIYVGLFKDEKVAALNHDLFVIENNLDFPTNFSEKEREKLLNSKVWKERNLLGTKRKNSSSKYFGVSKLILPSKGVRWCVQINDIYVGRFDTEDEAAIKFNEYVKKHGLPYKMNKIGA